MGVRGWWSPSLVAGFLQQPDELLPFHRAKQPGYQADKPDDDLALRHPRVPGPTLDEPPLLIGKG